MMDSLPAFLQETEGAFVPAMDLKAFAAGGPPQGFDQFLENGSRKPLIAAIEGICTRWRIRNSTNL